jgi:outer membrane protein
MKYLVKFFVVTLFTLVCTHASAEQKIVYIDMKYVLNNSKAGKGAQDYLSKSLKKSQKKIANKEKELKKDEADLLGKKNVLSKEAYAKSTDDLRKKVIDYRTSRRAVADNIAKLKAKARKDLLDKVNPILDQYSKENNVTLIIDKKYLIMGNTDLDITNLVIEELNKVLPSLNLE